MTHIQNAGVRIQCLIIMKISNLLKELERHLAVSGDAEVRCGDVGGIPRAWPINYMRCVTNVSSGEQALVLLCESPNDPKLSHGGAWRGSCGVRRRRDMRARK